MFSVVQACAAGIEIDTDRRTIKLNNNDESFRVEVYINNTENFAGAELGISCSDNLSLESSSSTAGSMTAATKDADGMYWTSFFESANKMPKSITVTLDFKCPKNTSSSLAVIEKVNILKKDGAGVTTERMSPNIRIAAGTSENIEEAGSTGGNSFFQCGIEGRKIWKTAQCRNFSDLRNVAARFLQRIIRIQALQKQAVWQLHTQLLKQVMKIILRLLCWA